MIYCVYSVMLNAEIIFHKSWVKSCHVNGNIEMTTRMVHKYKFQKIHLSVEDALNTKPDLYENKHDICNL
jgi:hypothetical protein